jgi:ankyrin repeat protein
VSEILDGLYRGDEARVIELLAAEPALNIFEAAALGRVERVRELLSDDAGLANAFGDDGFQPLGLACFFGRLEAARMLLEAGADPNTLARNEIIQSNALHAAVAAENKPAATRLALAKLLLDHGADPNARQGGGFRPIDAARQNGDDQLQRLLIERGAED